MYEPDWTMAKVLARDKAVSLHSLTHEGAYAIISNGRPNYIPFPYANCTTCDWYYPNNFVRGVTPKSRKRYFYDV